MNAPALQAQDAEVASPCVEVCRMNATSGHCEGCLRSIDEIASWSGYSAAQKRAVLELLATRKNTD